MIKRFYIDEAESVTQKIENSKKDFIFAVVADSHLDNSLSDTLNNIGAVDKNVNFDCLVHLGDFLNGNFPRKCTSMILKSQMDDFRKSIASGVFYPAQGNHDGFVDQIKYNTNDMALDEDWYEATSFVDEFPNVKRKDNKPYFYVDYPDKKIRLIIVCSFHYKGFYNGEKFEKQYGIHPKQVEWFREEALNLDKDWTIMLFSHDMPFSNFNEALVFEDNIIINGNLMFSALIDAKEKIGFDVAGWFIGHHHGDYIKKVKGINFILVASETAYVPCLWDMQEDGYFPKRVLNTVTEDLWDSVLLDKESKTLKLIRFGAGNDREASY